ncbi:STAS domain-containing protein [Kitasatospora sp. NPDC058063]|uniref:STAS domain-containing protein n=1 Tax=unclassified Kitasatospora TaxID=2633591 RepID=UPI0036D7A6F4
MNGQSNQPFIVRAHGEIDLDAAPSLRRALATALESHQEVVLDLSEVTFMDCAGLGALVRARNQADRCGARLVLRGADRRVVRLLKLTGLHRPWPSSLEVARARRALGRRKNRDDASMGDVPGRGPGAR